MKEKGKEEGKEKEGMAQNFPYITTEGTRCFSRMELTISPEKPVHYRSGVEEETSYSKSTTTLEAKLNHLLRTVNESIIINISKYLEILFAKEKTICY